MTTRQKALSHFCLIAKQVVRKKTDKRLETTVEIKVFEVQMFSRVAEE